MKIFARDHPSRYHLPGSQQVDGGGGGGLYYSLARWGPHDQISHLRMPAVALYIRSETWSCCVQISSSSRSVVGIRVKKWSTGAYSFAGAPRSTSPPRATLCYFNRPSLSLSLTPLPDLAGFQMESCIWKKNISGWCTLVFLKSQFLISSTFVLPIQHTNGNRWACLFCLASWWPKSNFKTLLKANSSQSFSAYIRFRWNVIFSVILWCLAVEKYEADRWLVIRTSSQHRTGCKTHTDQIMKFLSADGRSSSHKCQCLYLHTKNKEIWGTQISRPLLCNYEEWSF